MSADLLLRAKAGDGDARMELARAASRAGKRAEAEHWIAEAAEAGQQAALTQTGVWKLIGHRGPRDIAAGADIIRTAAASGEAAAKALYATLLVSSVLGPRDWDGAKRLLLEAAEAHEPRALLQIALMLPHERKWQETRLALADRAAGKAYPAALYIAGRILLEQGGQDGQAIARLALAARANEPNALKLLRNRRIATLEPSSPVFELGQINWARVAEAAQWPHARALPGPVARHGAPRIASFNRLLTAEECDYIVSRGVPYLKRNVIPGQAPDPRTNASASFGIVESDPLIQSLDELIAIAIGAPAGQGEPLRLLHYAPGQHFAAHCDGLDPAHPLAMREIESGGQRIRTLIVYLNEGYEGGETVFPRIGWRFKGKRGDALMWDNVLPDGSPDPRTLHEGVSPRSADKFVLSKWMRDRSQQPGGR